MLKKRISHNKTAKNSDLPIQGIFTRIRDFKQFFVQKQKIIEEEIDEEEESDDNCSDSDDEVFYSDLEDDDCSDSDDEIETDIDGNF